MTAGKDYASGGLGYGVVTTTYDTLASERNFGGISDNGNTATIVVVTGSDPNVGLPNLNSGSYGDVIWDFVNTTVLEFSGSGFGTILAPLAAITQQGGDLDGSIVVAGMTQTNGLHSDDGAFDGKLSGLPRRHRLRRRQLCRSRPRSC